jgi:hypothetical protein
MLNIISRRRIMKKVVLAILCCMLMGGGGVAVAQTGNLGRITVQMLDNFEYGVSYNGTVAERNLLGGQQIRAGETYTLKITFTASRDLEGKLMFALVDTTERANWWTQLTETTDILPDRVIKRGETVTFETTVRTIAGATSTQAAANALIFMTEGAGTRGRRGSGQQGNFNLVFTEFVLTKG